MKGKKCHSLNNPASPTLAATSSARCASAAAVSRMLCERRACCAVSRASVLRVYLRASEYQSSV
jgi:hypothetical protein